MASSLLAAKIPTAPPVRIIPQSSRQPGRGADVTTEAANFGEDTRRKRRCEDTKVEEPATVQDSQLVEASAPTTIPMAPSTTPVIPSSGHGAVAADASCRNSSAEPEQEARRLSVNHCHTPSMWV